MRDAAARWGEELRAAERGLTLDRLSDVIAEVAHAESPRPSARTDDARDEWAAVLGLVDPPGLRAGTRAGWPAPASLRILRADFWSSSSAPSAAATYAAAEEIRHWLFAGKDPLIAAAAAERGWALVRDRPGAEGLSACFASYSALAGMTLRDAAMVELSAERADRARASAEESFVLNGAQLGFSWVRAASVIAPPDPAGDPRQREQLYASPLFRRTAGWMSDRGIRLGFEERALLTPHLHRLLRLAAEGATVRQLAARFGVSTRTVEGQLASIRAALGATSLQSAIHLVGAEQSSAAPRPQQTETTRLTWREQSVAALVSQGWRNSAIAQHLGMSARTVETHLAHAMAKTGTSTRVQLAAWWSARG